MDIYAFLKPYGTELSRLAKTVSNMTLLNGALPAQKKTKKAFALEPLLLIGKGACAVDDPVSLQKTKDWVERQGSDYVLYDLSTQVIHAYQGKEWVEHSRIYLADHIVGGRFYYNPVTLRLHWAEINGDLHQVNRGRPDRVLETL